MRANEFDDDALDRLLDPLPCPVTRETWRSSLLDQTTRMLRRRRRVRRAGFAVALVTCYAAGAATMTVLPSQTTQAERPQIAVAGPEAAPESHEPGAMTLPPDVDAVSPELLDDFAAEPPAELLEHWAAGVPAKLRAAMYRRAGDRFLHQHGDIAAAARCYARSLDASSSAELAISTETDTWLLMSLKDSRQRERHHANNDG